MEMEGVTHMSVLGANTIFKKGYHGFTEYHILLNHLILNLSDAITDQNICPPTGLSQTSGLFHESSLQCYNRLSISGQSSSVR